MTADIIVMAAVIVTYTIAVALKCVERLSCGSRKGAFRVGLIAIYYIARIIVEMMSIR